MVNLKDKYYEILEEDGFIKNNDKSKIHHFKTKMYLEKDVKEAVIKLRNKLTIEKYNQYVKDQGYMGSFEDYIQVRILLDIGDFKQ